MPDDRESGHRDGRGAPADDPDAAARPTPDRAQPSSVIATYTPLEGQEASVLGSAMALEPDRNWIVSSYREQAALLPRGTKHDP
jgi:hypothetical protein